MAAYRRVYDSRHLQADCQEPGSAPEPYARQSSMGYLSFFTFYPSFCESTPLLLRVRYCRVCVCVCVCVAVPEMPRNVSVVNETRTTVSVTASLPRRGTMQSDTSATLPVSSWRIHYVQHANHSATEPPPNDTSRQL